MRVVGVQLNWNDYAETLDDDVRTAMSRALNRIADRGRTKASRAVRETIKFPASYLSNNRLKVSGRASPTHFEATISAADRPTSLARFTRQKPGQKTRKGGVTVEVHRGGRHTFPRSFLMALRNGNIGLAVRTDGELPPGAYKPKEIGENLFLLYGPSVGQALLDATGDDGIYNDISGELLEMLATEFSRQLDYLRGKR